MDPTSGRPASDVVNEADHGELVRILRRFGDERHADRIARAIIEARPVTNTAQLAEIVRDAIPAAAPRTSIGRAATRERVCTFVSIAGVDVSFVKNRKIT